MSAERAGDGLDSTAKQGGKLIHKEEEGGGTSVLAFEGSDIQDSRCVSSWARLLLLVCCSCYHGGALCALACCCMYACVGVCGCLFSIGITDAADVTSSRAVGNDS